MLESALHYASMGFSVIPVHTIKDGECSCESQKCNAPGKHPRIKWRGKTNTALSEAQIRDWWRRYPESNIGIVTGPISGIAVIDIDGKEGLRSLEEAGLPLEELPLTPTVRTGGGGIHLIYRYPEKTGVKTGSGILPKVDIRAEGGLIVAPPSRHASGEEYRWIDGRSIDDIDPADFDFSLLIEEKDSKAKETEKPTSGSKWYEVYLKGVGEGKRNDAAAKLAGRYFGMGMAEKEVLLLLQSWNLNNNPPMDRKELTTIVKSIRDREFNEDELNREEYLDAVSNIMRIKLSSVKRITGDPPQIVLEFDEGTCTLSTGDVLSPKALQQAVAESTKVVIRKLSTRTNPTHERLADLILKAAVDVDAGMEATGIGELTVLLRDFLSSQRTVPDLDEVKDVPEHGSFRQGKLIWVGLMDLVQRSGARWGMKTSIRQMAQRLRALGIERKTFSLPDRSSRIMWGIDPDRIGLVEGGENSEETGD